MGKKKVFSEEDLAKDLMLPGPGQMVGRVENFLGYDRIMVYCTDQKKRLCRIRGKLKRRVWIRAGDFVLVEPWSFEEGRGNILWRYYRGQAKFLRKRDLIPDEWI